MKWLLCLVLVWHIDYFIGTGKPGEAAFIKAIDFANKHKAKSVQIVPAFHDIDAFKACLLIWSEEKNDGK